MKNGERDRSRRGRRMSHSCSLGEESRIMPSEELKVETSVGDDDSVSFATKCVESGMLIGDRRLLSVDVATRVSDEPKKGA